MTSSLQATFKSNHLSSYHQFMDMDNANSNEQSIDPHSRRISPSPNANEESISVDSNNETSNHHQEICVVCKQWASNCNDYKFNFIKCNQLHCINSYHRECVDANSFECCSQINRRCNAIPLRTFKFIQDPYQSRFYQIIKKQKIFIDAQKVKNSQKRLCKRNYYKSIQYKGNTLTVGDCVEVRNGNSETAGPQWAMNVAMIKEICKDQNNEMPIVCIYWFWRERELKWQLNCDGIDVIMQNESYTNERRNFIDFHIYLDIDYCDEIVIDAITQKVIIFDKYAQFKKYFDGTSRSNNFKSAYFGECMFKPGTCSFSFDKRETLKKKQLEQIKKLQIEQSNKLKSKRPIRNDNIVRVKKIKKSNVKASDMPILQRMQLGINDTSDSSSSGDENGQTYAKKVKTSTSRKKILQDNKSNISNEAMSEMKDICQRLKIGNAPNIGSRLYYFKSHLEAYQCIDNLFRNHSAASFEQHVNAQKQSWCRDVKYAMYTKGQIVPLSVMKENISKRFNELKPFYKEKRR